MWDASHTWSQLTPVESRGFLWEGIRVRGKQSVGLSAQLSQCVFSPNRQSHLVPARGAFVDSNKGISAL